MKYGKKESKFETKGLPNGWIVCKLEDLKASIEPGFASGQHNQIKNGIPHLRPMNINNAGNIELSLVKYVEKNLKNIQLQKNDVLFNNTNSPNLFGKTALIKNDTNWAYSNHMTRIRFDTSVINSTWIAVFLHKLFLDGHYRQIAKNHVNQSSINSTDLATKIPIVFAPLPEQHRIVSKIESIFAQIDACREKLERRAQQSSPGSGSIAQLKSSVLKQAFEGKLVPQDPNDEPAQKLLKRVGKDSRKNLEFETKGLPNGWTGTTFKYLIKKIPLTGKKIKQKEYLKEGTIPIIDQGQEFIGGYTNDIERIVHYNLPVIVFGDHTKSMKFVDREFVAGADGIKVLKPHPNLHPKLFYYFMHSLQLPDKGYARHYQYLEKSFMHIPPLPEQHRIVAKIESIFARIDAHITHVLFA